jgi:hypothetical protein
MKKAIVVVLAFGAFRCSAPVDANDGGVGGGGGVATGGGIAGGGGSAGGGTNEDGGRDAGLRDAGLADGGVPDGGAEAPDAGRLDAGSAALALFIRVLDPMRPIIPGIDYDTGSGVAWPLDEDPIVAVDWTGPMLDGGAVQLWVDGVASLDAGVSPIATNACACDGGCACFRIDGARLFDSVEADPYPSVWPGFHLSAAAPDTTGSLADAGSWLSTRRIRWSYGTTCVATPALDPDGNLYVSTGDGIESLAPDGHARWQLRPGARGSQPDFGISGDAGFVVLQQFWPDGGNQLSLLSADDGTQLFACPFPGGASQATVPVRVVAGPRQAYVVASGDQLLSISFADGLSSPRCATASLGLTAATEVNPVAIGQTLCLGVGINMVVCVDMNSMGDWPTTSPGPVQLDGGPLSSLVVASVDGVSRVLGTVDYPSGAVFMLDASRTTATVVAPSNSFNFPLSVVRSATGPTWVVWTDWTSNLWTLDLDGGTTQQFLGDHAQVNQGADGHAYIASSVDREEYSNDFSTRMFWDAVSQTPNQAIPVAIDCNRVSGRGGVMYVVANGGNLWAELIRSPGIATDADWPKWQRDPANSGNAADDFLALYRCR